MPSLVGSEMCIRDSQGSVLPRNQRRLLKNIHVKVAPSICNGSLRRRAHIECDHVFLISLPQSHSNAPFTSMFFPWFSMSSFTSMLPLTSIFFLRFNVPSLQCFQSVSLNLTPTLPFTSMFFLEFQCFPSLQCSPLFSMLYFTSMLCLTSMLPFTATQNSHLSLIHI